MFSFNTSPDATPPNPWIAKAIVFSIILALTGLFPAYAVYDESSLDNSGLIDSFTLEGDIRRFAGETLYYDISFLWFSKAATAEVGMYEKNGQYYAILRAKTKGFIGFFTSNREHIYEAQFEVIEDGTRLRAKSFKRQVTKGPQVKKYEHFFNYDERVHTWKGFNNADLIEAGKEDIPAGRNFDDVLTAFYNARNSVYGPLLKDTSFTIFTIPEKGEDKILLKILGDEEANYQREIEGKQEISENLLLDIIVPKEVFITESGQLRFWSSKHFIPLETTVSDYIMLGDLFGEFRGRVFKKKSQSKFIISKNLQPN